MEAINASELKAELDSILEKVISHNDKYAVATTKGNAAILSENDYKGMVETIYIYSQERLSEKIKEGEKENPKTMSKYSPKDEW